MNKAVVSLLCAALGAGMIACGSTSDSTSGSTTQSTAADTAGDESTQEQTETASEPVDKVVVGLTASSFDTSPFGAGSVPRFWFVQNMYASLYCNPAYGTSLEDMQPWLAKSITKVDDLTYNVELYDYIHDSKGNAITSEDVVFSYEKLATEGQQMRIDTYLDNIEVVDDYNMVFHLKKNGPGVMEFLAGDYTLSICDKDWYENATEAERQSDPATTGAYEIKSYTAGSELDLVAVEDYWQTDESLRCDADRVNVKEIDFKVITENSMRSVALENHEIDATMIDATELSRFYDGTEPLDGWSVNITGGPYCSVVFLNMDEDESEFANDENLRLAALYALDSESILYGGDYDDSTGEVCYSLGTSAMAGYKDEWANEDYFTYDVEKAKEYYQASGHEEGDVTIRLLSRTSIADGTHAVMVENLEEAGFNVELLSYDQALFNTYKYDSTQWDMIFDNKGATGNIVTCWDNNFNPDSYDNGSVCFTHDDKLTELLTAATTTGSDEDIENFHQYLKSLACCKGLYTTYNLIVGQDGITNLATNANMMPRANNFTFAADYQSAGD